MPTLYDRIGQSYSATRTADPVIARRLVDLMQCKADGNYLDLGCGTGNYTRALAAAGGRWFGLDPSALMLSQARFAPSPVVWVLGDANHLPFGNSTLSGVVCTLAIHHFTDLPRSFSEARRVLGDGRLVIFTSFFEQMRHYWLWHYFPRMMHRSTVGMPSRCAVGEALQAAGFTDVAIEPYSVASTLEDLFLYSGKSRPELYLRADVRANMSSFAKLCDPDELVRGTEALSRDLQNGSFTEVAAQFSSMEGDYAFVIATA